MAASVHDDILLDVDLTGIIPTNAYDVAADGLEDVYAPAVVTERGITGKLHVHRLMDGVSPEKFQDYNYGLILTRAQLATLVGDVGKTVYFMPHYRDDADVATYRFKVFFESASNIRNIDTFREYYRATIYRRDNSDGTIG